MEPRCRDVRGSSALIQHVSETEIAEPIMQSAGQLRDGLNLLANSVDSSAFSQVFVGLVSKQAAAGYFAGSVPQNGVRLRMAAAIVPSSR